MNQRQLVKGMLDALGVAAVESTPIDAETVAVVDPRPTLIVPPPSKRAMKAAIPIRERFTRATLEAAIVEGVRERQQRERERRATLAIKRAGRTP